MDWYESITPTEFELLCMEKLKEFALMHELRDFKISHNEIVEAHDGRYQIDIRASFTALNITFLVFCECKCYKDSIKRTVVSELQQRLVSCGAHKGIVMAVNGFQQGAIDFAKKHGIALINVEPINDGPILPTPIGLVRKRAQGNNKSAMESVVNFISRHVHFNMITAFLSEEEKAVLRLDRTNGVQYVQIEAKNQEIQVGLK